MMNHTYRLVWNEASQSYVPAAEGTRARKKSGGCKALKRLCTVVAAASLGGAYVGAAHAGPTGGEVVAGQASINQTGTTTTVSQQSQNVSLNWQQFNVAANETVQFVQPSATSIALNRVIGAEASQIFGRLSANGQVFLINPNGVLFGQSAQVDVGGLVAATLNISDSDFLAGRYNFSSDATMPGSIANQGTITAAAGGSVALLGGQVSNQGTISARLGTVALAAGSAVSLDFSGRQLMNVQVDAATLGALTQNQHLIQADGGTVIMTAAARDALLSTVVNNTGVIEARTVQNQGGVIKLLGSFEGGTVNVGGTLDASAPNGGNGGFVETSGAYVKVAETARITSSAPQGISGTWLIDPADYTIAASGGDISGATLSANLENGNITILSTQGTVNVLGNGDINVNDDVTWSAANTLALTALGNVNVNAAITNTGLPADGGVTLRADSAGACVAGAAASACGTVNFAGAGHITAADVTLYYNPADSNEAADANGIGPVYATPTDYTANVTGALNAYMLVNDVSQLQAINTNRSGSYALGADIDASATSGWNGGAGFAPIGEPGFFTWFGGVFDGLGHSVSNLVIHRPTTDYVGLFGLTSDSTIRNVHLIGGSITGNHLVGALAGAISGGTVSNVSASALVSGSDSVGGLAGQSNSTLDHVSATGAVTGTNVVGGLLGQNDGGTVNNASASGVVTGDDFSVGGLIGVNDFGVVTRSWASGAVDGFGNVGGLVGENINSAAVIDSYATGAVNGVTEVGGLVGNNYDGATVSDAYATGAVTGNDNIGGLVGRNLSIVSNSSASGNVTGELYVGGLVGHNEGAIDNAVATGEVIALEVVGGLVGHNLGAISQSSAAGPVTGERVVGGLVARNQGMVNDAHATGPVIGIENVGGLIGENDSSGTVETVFAIGAVSGDYTIGGLVGFNEGSVNVAYATGAVSGEYSVGGLVGDNEGTVNDAHATGAVTGEEWVGGLVGQNEGDLSNAYAAGSVSGSHYVGGVVGASYSGVVVNARYNVDQVTINGGHHVTFGGLYGSQFQDWIDNGQTLDISDYAASLPFDVDTGSYLIGSVQGLRDLLGFSCVGSYSFRLTADLDLAAAPGLYIPEFRAVQFDGAGHTIANLSIDLPFVSQLGMFGYVGSTSTIGNLTLASSTVVGDEAVGALVGYNEGVISNASAVASVTGASRIGGLIGENSGTVTDSNASGSVAGEFAVGGLIGEHYFPGLVSNSSATASATGEYAVGGLLGLNAGFVENVYATGMVIGDNAAGGLIGDNYGAVYSAYATGSVTGIAAIGGLVGINSGGGTVSSAYATGSVSGAERVGGLVGLNFNRVSDAYATGSVTGQSNTGGLVGDNVSFGQVRRAYATGAVSGADALTTGGLVGSNDTANGLVSDSFWDIQTSGQSQSAGGTDMTSAEMRDADTFSAWDISAVGGSSAVWRIYEGYTGPLLRSFMTDLAVAVDDVNTTYNGTNQGIGFNYAAGGADTSLILTGNVNFRNVGSYNLGSLLHSSQQGYDITYTGGTLDIGRANLIVSSSDVVKTYDGTTTASGAAVATGSTTLFGSDSLSGGAFAFIDKNAGTGKTVTTSGVTVNDGNGGGNYNVTYVDNTSSAIDRAVLTLTASSDRRTYDGTTASSGNVIASGNVAGDAVSATQAYASKNVLGAGGSTLQVTSNAITDGAGADMSGNYNIVTRTAAGTIDAVTVTVGGSVAAADKTYDATVDTTVSGGVLSGVIGADTVTLLQSGSFADKNAGIDKAVTANFRLEGADAGNYVLANSTAQTTASIFRASISNVTGITAADKVYDGSAAAALDTTGATFVGIFAGDQLNIGGASGVFSDRNAAAGKTVSIEEIALSGADVANYILLSDTATTTASITPRVLTYTTTAASRVYDGSTTAAVTLSNLIGLVGDETLTVTGTGAFNSKDVATANTVTVTTATLVDGSNGGLASNYTIATGGTASANITARELTYTTTARDKIYDGTLAASVTLRNLTGLVGNETLIATGTGAFNSKDVTAADTVIVTAATLADGGNGGLASNYTIAAGGTVSAHITPANLTIAANDQIKVTGTPNPELTLSYRGFVAGESAANLMTQATASTAAEAASPPGNYAITASGASSSNYVFTYVPGTLTVTGTSVPGYVGTLAYLDDVTKEGGPDADASHRPEGTFSVLQIDGDGIRLPAGVQ